MRRPVLLSLLFMILGSACLPDAREAAVRVEVTYTFKAGCISVTARDAMAPERETTFDLVVLNRGPSTVTFAVFRQEEWSHRLQLIAVARERSCMGPVVALESGEIELRKPRVEPFAVTLEAADADADGYVDTADGGSDCGDSDPLVFPREDVVEALCNDVDDDCDGTVDEGFTGKGTACSDPCPGGQFVCNASRTGLACGNAPAKVSLFPDEDGDGAGREGTTGTGSICPGESIPSGLVDNADDCDDQDRHNRHGRPEACDGRDNTCDDEADEGEVCGNTGWKVLEDPALTGARQWKTVSLGPGGLPVWVAGNDGRLAVRKTEGEPFTSLDGSCGNHNWLSSWVRDDGTVFLAGSGGNVAQHDGTSCSNQAVNASNGPIHGLIGFSPAPSTTLILVNYPGRLSVWTPGTAPQERFNRFPDSYFDIHGRQRSLLLGVGGHDDDTPEPTISGYPGSGTEAQTHTLQGVPGGYSGSLRGVWMGAPTLAYAVGDKGLVMKWDGGTSWTRVPPPEDNAAADFTSVVVLDPSSIYVTATDGAIRRLTSSGWIPTRVYTSDQPLRDLTASSVGNIWAVGDNGKVVHFPE
jgi:Putative metal-binding motif